MDNETQPLDTNLDPGAIPETLQITSNIRKYWSESTKWTLFFSILGFLYVALLVLLMLVGSKSPMFAAGLVGILVAGALIFIPSWFLFQFSQKVKQGLQTDDSALAATGFSNLRWFYQYAGILMIIVLVLYAIMFLVLMTVAVRSPM